MNLRRATVLLLGWAGAVLAYTPIVLWHGMGDSCCNPDSMGTVKSALEEWLPGVLVHSIQIGASESDDTDKGFFDLLDRQINEACEQVTAIPELSNGFNAVGFSQGGLFMRALVQRCQGAQVRNLVTFGSPHMGVSDWPSCEGRSSFNCALARSLLLKGAYLGYVQRRVVQAQYYKDPKSYETYISRNIFLPHVNNELEVKEDVYASRIAGLEHFVMVRFTNESMVTPGETAWFGGVDDEQNVVPLRETDLYNEDWLGLKKLDADGGLVFLTLEGRHMQISLEFLRDEIVIPYFKSQSVIFDQQL
ncbi:palmitoyl-protein thioesterase 1, isoform CRA_a [Cladochytrium replicatum]|nr:palmitoyl-protein thioesterase 1, isoform CRA_a [Cladochytrium replicatum]